MGAFFPFHKHNIIHRLTFSELIKLQNKLATANQQQMQIRKTKNQKKKMCYMFAFPTVTYDWMLLCVRARSYKDR